MNYVIIFYVFMIDYLLLEIMQSNKQKLHKYTFRINKFGLWCADKFDLMSCKILFNNKITFTRFNNRFVSAKKYVNNRRDTLFCMNAFKNVYVLNLICKNKIVFSFKNNIVKYFESDNVILIKDILNSKYKIVFNNKSKYLLKNNKLCIYPYFDVNMLVYVYNNNENVINFNTIDNNICNIVNNINIFDKKIAINNQINLIRFDNINQINYCVRMLEKLNLTNEFVLNFAKSFLLKSNRFDLLKIYYLFFYIKIDFNNNCLSFKNYSFNNSTCISIFNKKYVLKKIDNKKVIKINGVKYYNFDSIII